MKLLIAFAACLCICNGYVFPAQCPNIVQFKNQNYEKHYIMDGTVSKPFHISYDPTNNAIMYHEDSEPFGHTQTHIYNMNTKVDTVVENMHDAVSSIWMNNAFYVSTNQGIHQVNPTTYAQSQYAVPNVNVHEVWYYNNKIYYTDYPHKDVYVYTDGSSHKVVNGPVNEFAIVNDVIYCSNHTGVYYGNMNDYENTVQYVTGSEAIPVENIVVHNGHVDIVSMYGVFMVNSAENTLNRVCNKGMMSMVFVGPNIIYSDEEHIVQLIPTSQKC